MRIAHIIMAHRDPEQLARLASRLLEDAGTACLIHIDRRSGDDVYRGVRLALDHVPRVRWLSALE